MAPKALCRIPMQIIERHELFPEGSFGEFSCTKGLVPTKVGFLRKGEKRGLNPVNVQLLFSRRSGRITKSGPDHGRDGYQAQVKKEVRNA